MPGGDQQIEGKMAVGEGTAMVAVHIPKMGSASIGAESKKVPGLVGH